MQQYVLRMQEMNDAKLLAEKELENTRACLQQEVVLTKQRLTLEVEETRRYYMFRIFSDDCWEL